MQGRALGPNPDLRRGPNDDLLLYVIHNFVHKRNCFIQLIKLHFRTDYVTWNGPDPDIRKGPSKLAKGPSNKNKLGGSIAKGPNSSNQKGPKGLAVGSIFAHKKTASTTDSRTR